MASRKEQKEKLRREREERERLAREAERRRRMVGYGVGGGLAVAAVAIVAVVLLAGGGGGGGGPGGKAAANLLPGGGTLPSQKITKLAPAAKAAGCQLHNYPAKSRDHIFDANQKVQYDSNPPTEGRHYYIPANDGAYGTAPKDVELVHALEHGRIIIWFQPTLPRAERAGLKAFFDDDSFKEIIVPRANMPYQVAASAWNLNPQPFGTGKQLACPRMNDSVYDALRTFRDQWRETGPEFVN